MRYRSLGKTGLQVSAVSIGLWAVCGDAWGAVRTATRWPLSSAPESWASTSSILPMSTGAATASSCWGAS
jgi:hypothetical protein